MKPVVEVDGPKAVAVYFSKVVVVPLSPCIKAGIGSRDLEEVVADS